MMLLSLKIAVEPGCPAGGANCAEQKEVNNIENNSNVRVILTYFFEAEWTMTATTFTTLAALEVIFFGEYHETVFKIKERTLVVFNFHFTKTIATQAIAVLQCYVLPFFTVEGHLAAMASRYVFGHTSKGLRTALANFLVKGFHTLWLFNFGETGA